MSTKVKGDKIKEGSIPFEALDESLQHVPALRHFVKQLDENDLGKDIEIPYANSIILYYGNNFITMNDGDSIDVQSYGPPSKITLSVRMESSSIILSVSNIEESSLINVYAFKIYKYINKIKKEFLPDDIGGADWNAKEGEEGYIENRTHYKEYYNVATDSTESKTYEGYAVSMDDYGYQDVCYYYAASLMIHGNGEKEYRFYVKDLKYNEETGEHESKTIVINENYDVADYGKLTVTSRYTIDGGFYIDILSEEEDGYYLRYDLSFYNTWTLDKDYLPNTIIKTTPQSLSDDEKKSSIS